MGETYFSIFRNPTVIHVTGGDRLDFLHRLTTQSFKTQKPGDVLYGACLRANAGVIGLFGALVREADVLLIALGQSVDPVLKFLEQFHFGEDVRFELRRDWEVVHWVHIGGASLELDMPSDSLKLPGPLLSVLGVDPSRIQNEVWLVPSGETRGFGNHPGVKELGTRALNDLYSWHGLPEAGVDLTEENILIEAPLDSFVHRTKGCYPGQEVIERIYTYGNVAKYVLNLEGIQSADGSSERHVERELKIKSDDGAEVKCGFIRSLRRKPNGSLFAVAQVQRVPYEKRKVFLDVDQHPWKVSDLSQERILARST